MANFAVDSGGGEALSDGFFMSGFSGWAKAVVVLGVAAALPPRAARAESVLAQLSAPSARPGQRSYGRLYQFPDTVRDYSDSRLYGYSFREELRSGAVRALEIWNLRSRGAYLMATDLFANGRLSTMAHTVLMVFPRRRDAGEDMYRLSETTGGEILVEAPDGTVLLVDGATGAVRPNRDFALGPLGRPGTPPLLRHAGIHLELHAVGRSPFLRRTRVTVSDAAGERCLLSTDELFLFGSKPESDAFRFDDDGQLFAFLTKRCPMLAIPRAADAAPSLGRAAASAGAGEPPLLVPAAHQPSGGGGKGGSWLGSGDTLPLLWQLFWH